MRLIILAALVAASGARAFGHEAGGHLHPPTRAYVHAPARAAADVGERSNVQVARARTARSAAAVPASRPAVVLVQPIEIFAPSVDGNGNMLRRGDGSTSNLNSGPSGCLSATVTGFCN